MYNCFKHSHGIQVANEAANPLPCSCEAATFVCQHSIIYRTSMAIEQALRARHRAPPTWIQAVQQGLAEPGQEAQLPLLSLSLALRGHSSSAGPCLC